MASSGLEHLLKGVCRRKLPEQQARMFSGLNELLVRRLVTIVAALGVIIVAFTLAFILFSISSDHHHRRQQQIHSLLLLASHGLKDIAWGAETIRPPLAEDLRRVLPDWAFNEQRFFIVTNADGIVQAVAGAIPSHLNVTEGDELPEVLRNAVLQNAGRDTNKLELIHLPQQGQPLLVMARPLSIWPGYILLAQPSEAPMGWRRNVTALLGSIIGLVAILIVLLVLYNWQAEQMAEESNGQAEFINRLEKALELGRCGLWDWDVSRGRIYLTRSMRELLGLPHMDNYMDLDDFLQLQHPEEPSIDELLENQLSTGENTFEQELRLRNKADGTWLWLKLRGALPADNQGALHLVGIAIDITAQKRAAADKRDAEQLLDQAIESISESFALWDAGMRLVKCNSKFREFHGLPAEACRAGRAYADIMGEARRRGRKREFRHVLEGANGRETIMELELEDGRWLQISERQMVRGGCVSVGTDITELKRKQLELENSRRELQQTVEALELSQAEIEHKNLRLQQMARKYQQEKERAEQALRTKSQILANVSHELNTPLNHVIGYADMLRQQPFGPLPEKYLDYVSDIHQAGQEIHRKISDIMTYAELSTDRLRISEAPVDMQTLMLETVEQFIPQAETKGVHIHCRCSDGLQAHVDAARISKALWQMVSNAVRYTNEGEVEVLAKVSETGKLILQVRDTGPGIPAEMLEHLGKPFERMGSAYNSHQGGSGIGLAIVRAVAEMHGGKMEVHSTPGRGTLVRMVLPVPTGVQSPAMLRQPAE